MDGAHLSRLTSDAFVAWSLAQPGNRRFELLNGEVIQMGPQRVGHVLVKARVFRALDDAVRAAGLKCQVFPDGMAVRIDDSTVYEPDAAIRCGDALNNADVIYSNPVVVVEVLSPSTTTVDTGLKLADYFRLVSMSHYLIVSGDRKIVVHHKRMDDGAVQTQILASGRLTLDPPGITLDIEGFFP